jgi:hypothetical protein
MQLAAPTAVMAGSLGYSKAAQYTTINRVDVAGAKVRVGWGGAMCRPH